MTLIYIFASQVEVGPVGHVADQQGEATFVGPHAARLLFCMPLFYTFRDQKGSLPRVQQEDDVVASFYERLPESLKTFADPALPRDKRLMAAQGLVPIPPRDQALMLFSLFMDDDAEISSSAEKSLGEIPNEIMLGVLSDTNTPPEFIHYFARTVDDLSLIEAIILNPSARDVTIAYLAGSVQSHDLLDTISSNHTRLLRSEAIFEALCANTFLSHSTLDRIIAFLSQYMNRDIRGPDREVEELLAIPEDESELAEEYIPAMAGDGEATSFLDDIDLPDDLIDETQSAESGEETIHEIKETLEEGGDISPKRKTLFAKIKEMNLPMKLKLAMLGNKEARYFLSREPVAVLTKTLLRNPRITDQEIQVIAQNPLIDHDVFRIISREKKWMKIYSIKLAMANNPKTPHHISLNLLSHLRKEDVKALSQNKNVSGVVSTTANRRWKEMRNRL